MPLMAFSTRSLSLDRIDVFRAHALEHVAEQGQQPVGVGAAAVLAAKAAKPKS